jgi:hypothetical protein
MNFKKEAIPYLEGKQFSNGFLFKYSTSSKKVESRLDYLEKVVAGKKIIHIGFADHIPLIKEKIKNGVWLHKRLLEKASYCVGIDIDQKAVEYIRNEFNIPDLFAFNVIEDEVPEALKQPFDYMILGEVLEHIDNPVLFLNALKLKYGKYVKHMVITVPNAFSFENVRWALKETEFINTDHRFWFTPFTLAKVGSQAGLEFQSFEMCQTWKLNRWWKNRMIKSNPLLRENLVMFFNISE